VAVQMARLFGRRKAVLSRRNNFDGSLGLCFQQAPWYSRCFVSLNIPQT
jgi:hypothetical protein